MPLGVRSMRERTEMLGEDLRVDSGSGTGTRAELRVSLDGRLQQPREGSP
jgi:signal transduction histidine kinase